MSHAIQHEYITETVHTFVMRCNGNHFADDLFKCILDNESYRTYFHSCFIEICPEGPIKNNPFVIHSDASLTPIRRYLTNDGLAYTKTLAFQRSLRVEIRIIGGN